MILTFTTNMAILKELFDMHRLFCNESNLANNYFAFVL